MLALHNFGAEDAVVALGLGPVPEGSVLRDVLGATPTVELPPSGRVSVRVDGWRGRMASGARPGEQAYA